MSFRDDPLARPEPRDRVFYATGTLLAAEDFTDEQLYHRAKLARVLAYLHGWGTVAGLQVRWEPQTTTQEERLIVEPGVAIDRLGRLIEVPRDACLRLGRWYEGQTDDALSAGLKAVQTPAGTVTGVVADVFVRFVACERGKTPAFATGAFDALDAVAPSRLRDGYELNLVIRVEDHPPQPAGLWATLAGVAGDGAALRTAIIAAWRESTTWEGQGRLTPLPEHAIGQDRTALFLARLVIPADAGTRPGRRGEDVVVDNDGRPFVLTAGALARLLDHWPQAEAITTEDE